MTTTEKKGNAAVSWLKNVKGPGKPYEDRYRFLSRDIPLVARGGRGELFAVMDGIGGAPKGMAAAQAVCDALLLFYREPEQFAPDVASLERLLYETNLAINDWGVMPGTDRPLGGAVGTVVWLRELELTVFHAGDTAGLLLRPGESPQLLTTFHEHDGGISRYFGLGRHLQVEQRSVGLEYGDLLLLVSDGVTKVFGTTEAAGLVQEVYDRTGDAGEAARELVARSRSRKSADDITAMVIEVVEDE